MNVSNAIFFNKQSESVSDKRLAAGKFATYTQYALIVGGEVFPVDLSFTLVDNADGLSVGFIENVGPSDISVQFELRKSGIVTSPGITLKMSETFDFGQFNGVIYGITVTNLDAINPIVYSAFGA